MRRNHQQLSILIFNSLSHSIYIGIARGGTGIVNVAHIEHRLAGQEEQIISHSLLILVLKCHAARVLALAQHILVASENFKLHLGITVAGSSHLGDARNASLHRLQVAKLQLGVDNPLIAHGVDRAVDMGNIIIVKAPQHVDYCIGLANVCQEFISQSLATAGTFHQSGDVNYLHCCGNNLSRMNQLGETIESLVGDSNHAHVGFDSTEREICRLRLSIRQAVKQGGLAHIRQSHNTTLQCHNSSKIIYVLT